MDCPACGTANPDAAKFCQECGERFPRRCPACGQDVGATAKFCPECGQRLDAAAAGSLAGTPARDAAPRVELPPRKYTPRHLAERILASRADLEGERKQVTILFADVVGSTELIRGRDAEEAQQLLDGVVRLMMDAVHRYEGTVSRLLGDGLMAMFGAPVAHEDHAVRACYAALAMLDAVKAHADRTRRSLGVTLPIRVGVSSGEVVARTIRDDLHMDYTAMGETVHLASRMEQLADPGTAVLTPETLALVEGYVQARSLGPVPVKGLPDPIELFQLLAAGQARTRLQAAATRGLTPFVGRAAEMETLYAALERARSGQGQVAALVGEPGVGKSRLVWELTHSHRAEGWLVLESGSVSYGKATSHLPVIDLLKAYCRIEPRHDARTIRERVLGKLLNLDEGLRPALTPILALLDVEPEDEIWHGLDPAQRRRQTLDAVKRLLLRESQEQPLLLVFEDLHWIDAETQALLDGLVESLPTARLLLLVNYRPEYRHQWGGRSFYSQLRIDPLGEAGADELLAGLLGENRSVEPLKALLTERTGGNPLFLEESVRSLVETGALVGERGAYRLPAPVSQVRVPATVQAVLATRIDRLPPAEKALLQTAAVVGKDVPDAVLRLVADRDDDDLRRGLAALQSAEFLYEASLFPELEYTFKHALTHEVAYGSLLQDRRKALHGRVLAATERLYPDRLDEHVQLLAHHALRAEAWEQAARYARLAGEKARSRSADREAIAALDQALLALQHLPESRETLEEAIDVRLILRTAFGAISDNQGMIDNAREVESLAHRLGDERQIVRVMTLSSRVAFSVGDPVASRAGALRAIRAADALGDPSVRLMAHLHMARDHHERGEYHAAIEEFRLCIDLLDRQEAIDRAAVTIEPAIDLHSHMAWTLAYVGAFDTAADHAEEANRAVRGVHQPWAVILLANRLGAVEVVRGRLAEAIALLQPSYDLAVEHEVPNVYCWASASLGMARVLGGRVAKGITLLEQAEVAAEAVGMTDGRAVWLGWLAEAYIRAGRLEDAKLHAEQAVGIATKRAEQGELAKIACLMGEIAATASPPDVDEAEERYREALMLAEEMGMRPLQSHCRLGLGKLYRAVGRAEEARAELTVAVEMLREMGMSYWLPEAETELAAVTAILAAEPTH